MVEFYGNKKKAMGLIEGLIREGSNTRHGIILDVMRSTGFGKKFINGYIDDLIKCNVAKEVDGKMEWVIKDVLNTPEDSEIQPRDTHEDEKGDGEIPRQI
jgi:hypothetical protein